jgi:hypothetical protein
MSSDSLPPVIHVGRNPEVICLKDRDFMVFLSDTVGCFAYSTTMSGECGEDRTPTEAEILGLAWRYTDTDWAYEGTIADYPKRGERAMIWYRLSQTGQLVSNPRFLYFIDAETPDGDGSTNLPLKVFREVISPRVSYDPDSNSVSMLFWTNTTEMGTIGAALDQTKVIRIKEDEFSLSSDTYKNCFRTLCFAYGNIFHMDAEGGYAAWLTSYGADHRPPACDASSSGGEPCLRNPDMIPLFHRPIVVDGWPLWQADLNQDGNIYNDGRVPILDFIRGAGGGGGGCVGSYQSPKDLTYLGAHTDETRGVAATWDRTLAADAPPNFQGTIVSICVGMSYNPAGALKMWIQDFTYDSCGMLVKIGEERGVEIDRPKDC